MGSWRRKTGLRERREKRERERERKTKIKKNEVNLTGWEFVNL
jgi:hypothetical protein